MIPTVCLLADAPHAAAEVAGWLFREWGYRYPGRTLAMAEALFMARAGRDRLPIAWLALDGGVPVGTASLVDVEVPEDEPGPWVASVFVPAAWRGQGIATRLMDVVEEHARRSGARRLLLSAAVPALYLQRGYVPTGATKNGEPVMQKAIVAGP